MQPRNAAAWNALDITRAAASSAHTHRAVLLLAPVVLTSIALLLRLAPPDSHTFYPACPLHQLTGLLCPGCGGTRCLAALLHFDPTAAWHANPLTVILLPFAALFLLRGYIRVLRGSSLAVAWPTPPHIVTALLLATAVLFGISRNLP